MSHNLNIYDNDIETTKSVKLFGIEIDHQLRFNQHISTLSFKVVMQLIKNTLCSLRTFMGKVGKSAIINSSYMPILTIAFWFGIFVLTSLLAKTEYIQKRCLTFQLDHESIYEALIGKKENSTMEIKRLRGLTIDIFKTINGIDPSYMKVIFTSKVNGSNKVKCSPK